MSLSKKLWMHSASNLLSLHILLNSPMRPNADESLHDECAEIYATWCTESPSRSTLMSPRSSMSPSEVSEVCEPPKSSVDHNN